MTGLSLQGSELEADGCMMARRALHLRRKYVEDRPVLFGTLALLLGAALAVVIALLNDPLRGLLAGALPVMFGLIVWSLTNGAGYQHRHPDSLPEDRSSSGAMSPTAAEGDPFNQAQPPLSPAEHARKAATGKKKSGRGRRKKSDAA